MISSFCRMYVLVRWIDAVISTSDWTHFNLDFYQSVTPAFFSWNGAVRAPKIRQQWIISDCVEKQTCWRCCSDISSFAFPCHVGGGGAQFGWLQESDSRLGTLMFFGVKPCDLITNVNKFTSLECVQSAHIRLCGPPMCWTMFWG